MKKMNSLVLLAAAIAAVIVAQTTEAAPGGLPVCWRDSYNVGVGTIPKGCEENYELDGALCYPVCEDGYYGVGPVCWQSCLPGMHDGGVFCYGGGHSEYTKKSYGRTAGKIPGCGPHMKEQWALCYKTCPDFDNWIQVGPVCWYNGSGNADYTKPCKINVTTAAHLQFLNVPIAYGKTDLDCQNLHAEFGYIMQGSKFCIQWAIDSIVKHKFEPTNCTSYVTDAVQSLYQTRVCELPAPPTTTATVPTTTVSGDTTVSEATTTTTEPSFLNRLLA